MYDIELLGINGKKPKGDAGREPGATRLAAQRKLRPRRKEASQKGPQQADVKGDKMDSWLGDLFPGMTTMGKNKAADDEARRMERAKHREDKSEGGRWNPEDFVPDLKKGPTMFGGWNPDPRYDEL